MASEDSIFVNYVATEGVLEDLGTADKNIHTALDVLQDAIRPLRATWSGASEAEYTIVQARWNADIDAMDKQLIKAQTILGEMSDNYSGADNRSANNWAQI